MRFALYCGASVLCAAGLLIGASNRPNVYAASVVLSQSTGTLLALGNFALMCLIILGRLLVWLFFGDLRVIEIHNLHERGWYTLTENVISLAMLDHDIDQQFAFCIAALMFSRIFHWICRDRSELIFQTANGGSRLNHARLVAAFFVIHFCDIIIIRWCFIQLAQEGPNSIFLLVAFEFTLSLQSLHTSLWKYIISLKEWRYLAQNPEEDIWEKKTDLLFIIDNIFNISRLILFLLEFWIMLKPYGIPIHVIRDLYITTKDLFTRIGDRIKFERTARELDMIIVEATAEDIEHDTVCIICREDMRIIQDQPQRLVPKKLRCTHVLHHGCLKGWLERSQRCPTCRAEVKMPPLQPEQPLQQQLQQQQQHQHQHQHQQLQQPQQQPQQPQQQQPTDPQPAAPQPGARPQPSSMLQPITGSPQPTTSPRTAEEYMYIPGHQLTGNSTNANPHILQAPASLNPLVHPAPVIIVPKYVSGAVTAAAAAGPSGNGNAPLRPFDEPTQQWTDYPLNLDSNGAVSTILPNGLKAIILNPLNDQQRQEADCLNSTTSNTISQSISSATANGATQLYHFDPSTVNFVRAECVGKPRVSRHQEAMMTGRRIQLPPYRVQTPWQQQQQQQQQDNNNLNVDSSLSPSSSNRDIITTENMVLRLEALEAQLDKFERKQESMREDLRNLMNIQQENSVMMREVLGLFKRKFDDDFDGDLEDGDESNVPKCKQSKQ